LQNREPIFNVPAIVTATIALLAAVHALREFVLSIEADQQLLLLFAFIPLRYEPTLLGGAAWPGGVAAQIWTFVTYALIHGDWMHLAVNAVWLLAFGTPVARRFGPARFIAFFAVTAAAGAAVHLITHAGERVWMVGASASISGFMAAAIRFAFQRNGPLSLIGSRDDQLYRQPAMPLMAVMQDIRTLAFLAVWFGLNLLFGLGSLSIDGSEQAIAWQAHIGGFLAGLIAFALFDPVRPAAVRRTGNGSEPTIH
jgi:membrane associated rhomboid family serine protease